MICNGCPRHCGVDRVKGVGYCLAPESVRLAKVSVHEWEEPCISGKRGSGTVFFSGCNLRCVYCQNSDVSNNKIGEDVTVVRLAEIFKELEEKGVNNINLVTPSHYVDSIIKALDIYHPHIPVVYNTSGYDSVDNIRKLKGYVDIFLTDLKYVNETLSKDFSGASDYFKVAFDAITEMVRQQPDNVFDLDGIMTKGVMIRHLVLPNHTDDSIKVLECIKNNFPNAIVSIMSQYTPFYKAKDIPELNRPLKPMEYTRVLSKFNTLGLEHGYKQSLASSTIEFIPDFDLSGVKKN